VEGLSLEEYSEGLAGFSFLVEKGFLGYFLCTCAWCFLLVILVTATNCLLQLSLVQVKC
jgi:hypothetical protein